MILRAAACLAALGAVNLIAPHLPAPSRALVGPRPVMPKLYDPGSRLRSRAITPR